MERVRRSVDCSALGAGNGIGRYLRSLLPRLIEERPDDDWIVHARVRTPPLPDSRAVRVRRDAMPDDAGRVASLFTSQPWWLARDLPALFWGPAHRLPVRLPACTAAVVTVHDLCSWRAPETMRASTRWLDRALMPPALRRADRIIAVSHATARDLQALFPLTEGKVTVVHEAAEPAPAATAHGAAGLDLPRPFVLFVGTLEPRKNLERLLRAFARTAPGVDLVLAGGAGWQLEAPARMAQRLGIADRVHGLGRVSDELLARLYHDALFVAAPSVYEGFGLPVLEALAHGTPVLYAHNSSLPEVAGDAGLPVDALSVDSIHAGLARLMLDAPLRAELAGRARAQAARFSWDRAARETLAVFDAAIQARQAAQGGRRR